MNESDVEISLRIAALKTCLDSVLMFNPESRSQLVYENRLQSDLNYLMYSKKDVLISINDLKIEIFPKYSREVSTNGKNYFVVIIIIYLLIHLLIFSKYFLYLIFIAISNLPVLLPI